MQLSTWDKEELDDKLANRVQVSKRAVAKVIQAFDRLMQRNEKITLALKGELDGGHLWNLLQSCPEECMLSFYIQCFGKAKSYKSKKKNDLAFFFYKNFF